MTMHRHLNREQWEAVAVVLRLKRVDQRRFLDYFGVVRPREIPAARLIEVLRLAINPPAEWQQRGQQ